MKKLISEGLLLAIVGIILVGCAKNEIIPATSNENNPTQLVTLKSSINQEITMLHFSSYEQYDATINRLERENDILDDAFLETYGYLNEEELNKKEEEINHNDRQALLNFVKSYNFQNSMLSAYIEAEEKWLNTEDLSERENPKNQYVVTEAEMAMLNKDGEVKIGDVILKITANGYVEFTDASVDNLISFNVGNLVVLQNENIKTNYEIAQERAVSNCHWWKGQTTPKNYDNNKKRVYLHRHFHKYPHKATSETQITSYKKSGSKWKRYRAKIGVANHSFFKAKEDCSKHTYQAYDKRVVANKKTRNCRLTNYNAYGKDRAENEKSVIGNYTFPGTNSLERVLSW